MEAVDTHQTLEHEWMHCPSRSVRWDHLCHDLFSAHSLPDWPQFRSGAVLDFYQVRCALWFLCEQWDLQPGDEVLMPSYNCGSEIDPFHAYGVKVVFYPVDRQAQVNQDAIQELCGPRTRAVYVTHYFGWGHNIKAFYAWCRERNIKVIEDCALALFSLGEEGYLGSNSDAAVFSLKKFLPVPDGAVLVLRDAFDLEKVTLKRPGTLKTIRNLLPFVKSNTISMLSSFEMYRRSQRGTEVSGGSLASQCETDPPTCPPMPEDYYFDMRFRNWRMSQVSSGILRRINPEQVLVRRRENYSYLLERLRDVPHFAPLFDGLPPGVCPLGLVAVVPNRRSLVNALADLGIPAFPWWEGYHRSFDWSAFPDARFLKDSVVCLPINEFLRKRHMDHIAASVKLLLSELKC